jgi:hypothetical protein
VSQAVNEVRKQGWEFLIDVSHLFVLCSFAFAQPLFDILSRNAEFFVVRRSEPLDVILLILVLCVLIPTLLAFLELVGGLLGHRVRKWVHGFLVAVLMGIIILPALKHISSLPGTVLLAIAGVIGLGAAIAYLRLRPVRMFVTVLLPVMLIFPVFFVFNSPVWKVVFPDKNLVINTISVKEPPPIVFIVFDEFPVTSLMDERRQIDPIRYPNFAALAQDATWFRNATTVSENTTYAVPAMLTGRYPDPTLLPTISDHPDNIFTLLAGIYKLKVFGAITALCPAELCERTQRSLVRRMNSLFSDLSLVYLHLILPEGLGASLPSVSHNWMDFGGGMRGARKGKEGTLLQRFRKSQVVHQEGDRLLQFTEVIAAVEATEQPTFYFMHSLLPHIPYNYLPSGKIYGSDSDVPRGVSRETWTGDEWDVIQGYQRHLLQVGFVDTLLGKLLGRLKEVGMYDRSLIVVTSDHGASFQRGDSRRVLTRTNFQDIMSVPLFIKAPNQRQGVISDRNVEIIDIAPSIADILGITLRWPVDGHSALDPSVPERKAKVIFYKEAKERMVFDSEALDRKDVTLRRKLTLFGSGTKSLGLFAAGPYGDLVGRPVTTIDIREEPNITAEVNGTNLFADVDLKDEFIPAMITGRVKTNLDDAKWLNLAIAINGTIQAVTRTSVLDKGRGTWSAVVDEASFHLGQNDVDVFLVSASEGTRVLLQAGRAAGLNYVLIQTDQGGHELITSSAGAPIPVIPSAMEGHVELAEIMKNGARFSGWAADIKNSEPPRSIVVFVNGKVAYSGSTFIERPDVVKHYKKRGVLQAGFRYAIPSHLFGGLEHPEVRLFAISNNGLASELHYPKGYKWAKLRGGIASWLWDSRNSADSKGECGNCKCVCRMPRLGHLSKLATLIAELRCVLASPCSGSRKG